MQNPTDQQNDNYSQISECNINENVIYYNNILYCVTDTIKNYYQADNSAICDGTTFSITFQVCYQQQSNEDEAISVCRTGLSVKACIQAQAQCSQNLTITNSICRQVLSLDNTIQNSTYASIFQNLLFSPQQIILSNYSQLQRKYNPVKIYETIFTNQGQILYDGPIDVDICQIIQNQASYDEMQFFRQSNYEQKDRFNQFGNYQRLNELTNVQYDNYFNQNYTFIKNEYPQNWTQKCAFSSFQDYLYIQLYAIDYQNEIQQLYVNITDGNYTLMQNVKFIPLTPENYTIQKFDIIINNTANQQLALSNITIQYKNSTEQTQQDSLITSLTDINPMIIATSAKNKFQFNFVINNNTTSLKIVFICIFTIFGVILSTVHCCNNSGSYSMGMSPTKSLKIKMINDEIQEIYQPSYMHFLTWIMECLSYVCYGYSFSMFVGSFQLYIQNSKNQLPQSRIVSYSTSELIVMYIITFITLLYQKIYQTQFKFFVYQTQWTDNVSTNLADSRLVYILNKLYKLQMTQPANIIFTFLLSIIFYYVYDEYYRINQSSLGFNSVDNTYSGYGFVFIFTLSSLIAEILKYLLSFIKHNNFMQFEQTLGSNNLSLIIQDSQYTFTLINYPPSQSADILEIAQEQSARSTYNIKNDQSKVVRYYLTQNQEESPMDLISEIQRLYAYCKFQIKNAGVKINGVKEKQIFDMIHFLPDIQQIADNTRALASGSQLIQVDKLTSFLNLPWFIDLNFSGSKIYRAETSQLTGGVFADNCSWRKFLNGYYKWYMQLAFINISTLFYTQVCNIGAIGFIITLVLLEFIQFICNILIKNSLSYSNCVEKQWIN